jgi:HlyD family secretion protein
VDNPEQKLKPGMTANLTITIDERNDVLKVPNSALRFTPQDGTRQRTRNANGAQGQNAQNGEGQGQRRQRRQGDNAAGANDADSNRRGNFAPASAPVLAGQTRIVWVLGQDGKPERRRITVGLSDGSATEIVEGDLKEGDMVITGQQVSGTSSAQNNQSRPPGFGNAPRVGGGGGRGR